ncbi:hypothetical protein HYR99_41845, partial [Candidatus Poribacteria bacterium]|nr:hypothetical protein [Candidatus Poribacteria bacterium]
MPSRLFLISVLFYFLMLTPSFAGKLTLGRGEEPLRVIQANTDSLIFEFELPPLKFNDHEIEGQSFSQIDFEGATLTMEPGHPHLPFYAKLIGIPVDASPYTSVINSQSEIRPSKRIIPAQSETRRQGDAENDATRNTQMEIDTDFYRQDRFQPVNLVEVVPVGFIREQRVARLQIQPIQYNPAKGQLKIYHVLQLRIDFNRPEGFPKPFGSTLPPAAPSTGGFTPRDSLPFEQFFQANLLNYQQARTWRQPPSRQIESVSAAPAAQASTEEKYKIWIDRTDIYKITYSDLRGAGADLENIDFETVKMENGGRQVGVYIFDGNADGVFDRDDAIIFYGQGLIGNKFTNDNVYWLSWRKQSEGGSGSQVGIKDASPKTPNAPIPFAFKKTEHFEKDRLHDALLDVRSELADHYFWTGLTGGTQNLSNRQKDFPLQFPYAVPRTLIQRDAELRIKLQGISREGNAQHLARIQFNGIQLGAVVQWRQQAAPLVTRIIEQRRFIQPDSANFLTIIAEDQNGTPPSQVDFYLDWFELDYWHTFQAAGGSLEFSSDTEPRTTGTVQYQVTDLRRPDIDVYQIRGGSLIAKLVNGKVDPVGRSYTITFEDQVTQPSSYFVVERDSYAPVNRIARAKQTVALRNPANQADYIMISHRDFLNSIQPLADFRKSQGLSVMSVDVDEVYDQFSNGIFNPLALQKFLRYAYTSWRAPNPTYVLLVGDAHYDYKSAIVKLYQEDHINYNLYPIYVPTFHGWAPESGETAMDHRFVTVSGDDPLPDMFIGRLSVQFPRELDDMVKKIIDYETKLQQGPWQGRLMQVADNNVNHPTDDIFQLSRERLIAEVIPVAYETRKVYLGEIVSPERTKQTILRTIDEGVLIAEYSGHGGTETWADENIFRIEDAQGLRNERLPFMLTTTCLNGQIDKPLQFGLRSLSEQFMMGRSGAIATLSATRLTFGSANAAFDEDLFKFMFTVKPPTLGGIIAAAKTEFIMKSSQLWIPGAEQFTLFGDPATRLALPDLEIQTELESIAVDANKGLVLRRNAVGRNEFSPITGKVEFRKATDFSTGAMSAVALFANDLDANPNNDRPRRKDGIQVWLGEFGDIRIPIPPDVAPGRGVLRLFAFNDQHAAVGGTKFWTYQPVILDVREVMDDPVDSTGTLNLFAQIVDNEGVAGIKSVDVIWSDTADFKDHTVSMILAATPPPPAGGEVKGGGWWTLQTPIPLPKGGRLVRYTIVVTDTANNIVQTERKSLKVPEGANIAIALTASRTAPIRYAFSKEHNAYTLAADLVNDGGKPIPRDIEVWFSEGEPDRNGDNQIDANARVLGKVVVKANQWKPGTTALQEASATLILKESLSTGFHKIYVFADPESPDDDHTDAIIGKLDEPRSFDNKGFRNFIVNEFALKADEELIAFSLDRTFDAFFPVGASEPTTLSIEALEPSVSFQPSLSLAPLPRVATLRGGGLSRAPTVAQAYKITLNSDVKQLAKPAEIKLRFDLNALQERVQQSYGLNPGQDGFDAALQREASGLAIYAWQPEINAWKQQPSEILRDEKGGLLQERFVTPTQAENTGTQPLRVSYVRVDPNLTPVGKWIILFLDSDRYEVLLQRKGSEEIEKLNQSGQLDKTFRDEVLGIELDIPRNETDESNSNLPFEFGDVLTFETDLGTDGDVRLVALHNANRGSGSANVSLNIGPQKLFELGDWLIFLKSSELFELRNGANEIVRYTHGTPVEGRVNQPLALTHLGIEVLVTSGDQPFELGDKIKFSTAMVGVVSMKTKELKTVSLMMNSDRDPPKLQLWVNGAAPQAGSVIPPRPEISLFLEDENGIDLDSFIFSVSKNDGAFEKITDFNIVSGGQVTTVPIRYKPILFIGRYLFRIWLKDLNRNELGGEGGFREFLFFVEEQPDLEPPKIEIRVNGKVLTDGVIVREQPQFEVQITDAHGIDPATVQFAFGPTSTPLLSLPRDRYDFKFDVTQPTQVEITFNPDLPNDAYQIQVLATDVSENASEAPVYRFRLNEPVAITDLLNVPNPL